MLKRTPGIDHVHPKLQVLDLKSFTGVGHLCSFEPPPSGPRNPEQCEGLLLLTNQPKPEGYDPFDGGSVQVRVPVSSRLPFLLAVHIQVVPGHECWKIDKATAIAVGLGSPDELANWLMPPGDTPWLTDYRELLETRMSQPDEIFGIGFIGSGNDREPSDIVIARAAVRTPTFALAG